MHRQFYERELPPASVELVERWVHRPGSILLRQPGAQGSSTLYFAPRWRLRQRGDAPLETDGCPFPAGSHPPLELPYGLAQSWRKDPGRSPCGLVGYLSYDLGSRAANCLHPLPLPAPLPELWLGLYDAALILGDAGPRLAVADLSPLNAAPASLEALWEERAREFFEIPPAEAAADTVRVELELPDKSWHHDAVCRIQDYLRRGHIYQANLTAQIRASCGPQAWPLFQREFARNPTEFAAYLCLEGAAVTCFSPERLLSLSRGWVTTSPIKGTVPIDGAAGLQQSAKDRAEHVMIVDLSRNDLGRVCDYGTVTVETLMRELRLRGLAHLVSDVRGRLRAGAEHELLPALFPGGSITGAPKLRAMQIISELEQSRRGIYTGSVGVVRADGSSDWNIAIRTAVWSDGEIRFGCGGGIVIDSDPEREYDEALLKASSFVESLRALHPSTQLAGR